MSRNKSHKQRFASKHAAADKGKGRKVGATRHGAKVSSLSASKDREAQALQRMRARKASAALQKSRIGHVGGVPRIVGVVPANESANTVALLQDMCGQLDAAVPSSYPLLPFTVARKDTRMHFTFVCESECSDQECVDVAKVADVLVLVLDVSQAVQDAIRDVNDAFAAECADEDDGQTLATTWFADVGLCITDFTRDLVTAINSQGAPSVVVVLRNLHTFTPRQQRGVLRVHQRYFMSVLHDTSKVISVTSDADVLALLRTLQVCKLRAPHWREQHPYMVVERTVYDAATQQLTVVGHVRGLPLYAKQLMHLTGYGTYQIASIAVCNEGSQQRRAEHGPDGASSSDDDAGVPAMTVVDTSTADERESLVHVQANATLDDNDGMPTEHDVALHEAQTRTAATRRLRVPAGVSEYQAAWYDTGDYVDSDGSDDAASGPAPQLQPRGDHYAADDVHDDVRGTTTRAHASNNNNNNGDAEGDDGSEDGRVDRFAGDAMSYRTTRTDIDFLRADDVVRLERMTDEEKAQEMHKLKQASAEEAWHPDMVDTPVNQPARERFAKYRALKSFRTGKWDVTENLPVHYAYIYKLQNYARIRAAALQRCDDEAADEVVVGRCVGVTLVDVPATVAHACGSSLLIASGQLEHEQKWSVLHFQLQRVGEHDEPIKSKTPMLAHMGFRKYYVAPLFSEVAAGDRTKFARYFHEGDKFRIASFFGPITYTPCPILLYQVPSLEEQAEGVPLRLACFGGALPPNPDFLLLKRAVLSGRVAVIHKKQIVVKYMFFNEDDVRWFQPVDLYTKLGRRGSIVKPVGTHGLFKATFNELVMQHDVVCMDLYKRVFPKWTTVPYNALDTARAVHRDDVDDADDDAGSLSA